MSKVLSDHLQRGKKLIPPILANTTHVDVSWINKVLPEILWHSLINEKFGYQDGAEISKIITEEASKIKDCSSIFSFISSFENQEIEFQEKLLESLLKKSILKELQVSLNEFINIYPDCPLSFLVEKEIFGNILDVKFFISYKNLLNKLFNKSSVESTFMLGNVIYSLFICKRLTVPVKSRLSELPKLKDYPDTEVSLLVASSMRATINIFFNESFHNSNNNWCNYFWKRSYELEKCYI